jgi:hypothetical protein
MRAAIEDGKEATKLLAYSDDFDEPTGRTEVTVNLQHPSQPEIQLRAQPSDAPGSKPSPVQVVFTVVKKFPPWGAVIVALAALAAYVYLQTH